MKKYFCFLLICVFSLLLIGCNDEIIKKEYVISFNTYTEQSFESIKIDSKQTLDLPTPSRIGYQFDGWYPNDRFIEDTKVTNSTIVGKTITLYAKWTPIEIKISLDAKEGTLESSEIIIFADQQIILPTPTPNDSNYLFDGWYMDNTKISNPFTALSNVSLTAKYVDKTTLQDTYNVTFNLDGGHFYDLTLTENLKNSEYYRQNTSDYYEEEFNQVVANFLMQYNQTINNHYPVHCWFFFDFSYRNAFAGENSSNSNADFFNNWRWLYQYLAFVGTAKDALTSLYLNNLNGVEDVSWSNSLIRAEISAFINAYQFNEHSILSADYGDEATRMGFVELLNLKEYKVGEVTPLLIPIKDGYTFMGWYDNPEFTGLPIYEFDVNSYGDKILYAKWN